LGQQVVDQLVHILPAQEFGRAGHGGDGHECSWNK
jgi:hypothetical protein